MTVLPGSLLKSREPRTQSPGSSLGSKTALPCQSFQGLGFELEARKPQGALALSVAWFLEL